MNNIKVDDFENICRTCMCNSDLISISGSNIVDVLQFLSGSRYRKTDELPQHLCAQCLQNMNDIQAFASLCKSSHFTLLNCLINFKSNVAVEDETINTDNVKDVKFMKEDHVELATEDLVKEELLFEQITAIVEIEERDESELILSNSPDIQTESLVNNSTDNIDVEEYINTSKIVCLPINEETPEIHLNKETQKTKDINLSQQKDERAYQCYVCYKKFQKLGLLSQHEKVHSNQRFDCDKCSKSFEYASSLIQHKRLHTGERPYQCDICNKRFTQKHSLFNHKKLRICERS